MHKLVFLKKKYLSAKRESTYFIGVALVKDNFLATITLIMKNINVASKGH